MLRHENREVPAILSTLKAQFSTLDDFEREFPSLCFALATGVGKTRLMGAEGAFPTSVSNDAQHHKSQERRVAPEDTNVGLRLRLHPTYGVLQFSETSGQAERSPVLSIYFSRTPREKPDYSGICSVPFPQPQILAVIHHLHVSEETHAQ
jgi:hypothetical protein